MLATPIELLYHANTSPFPINENLILLDTGDCSRRDNSVAKTVEPDSPHICRFGEIVLSELCLLDLHSLLLCIQNPSSGDNIMFECNDRAKKLGAFYFGSSDSYKPPRCLIAFFQIPPIESFIHSLRSIRRRSIARFSSEGALQTTIKARLIAIATTAKRWL